MINDYGNHWIPSPGYKYLSNGTIWTDGLFLGRTDSIENWHETNEEPPAPVPDEPTVEDKAEAYDILIGVGGL